MTAQLDRDIFGNLLSRKEPAGTRRYYHFDGLGSTTALSDEGGGSVATLLYDAWGNQRAATGAPAPNYRFTGAELDSATGLYHMGARFYEPTNGRWLSEDAIQNKYSDPRSLNFYAYAFDLPTTMVDKNGRAPCFSQLSSDVSECVGSSYEGPVTVWGTSGVISSYGAAIRNELGPLSKGALAGTATVAGTTAIGCSFGPVGCTVGGIVGGGLGVIVGGTVYAAERDKSRKTQVAGGWKYITTVQSYNNHNGTLTLIQITVWYDENGVYQFTEYGWTTYQCVPRDSCD